MNTNITAATNDRSALAHSAHLLIRTLTIVHRDTPVESARAAMPLADPHLWDEMLDLLQLRLTELLTVVHGPSCDGASPAALVGTIRRTICPHCFPSDDIRAVIRYARRPTGHMRKLIASDLAYWIRVTALAVAASSSNLKDPYAVPVAMLDASRPADAA